jgi:hypothetical protein
MICDVAESIDVISEGKNQLDFIGSYNSRNVSFAHVFRFVFERFFGEKLYSLCF